MIVLVFQFSLGGFHFGLGGTGARSTVNGSRAFGLGCGLTRQVAERRVPEDTPCLTETLQRLREEAGYTTNCGTHGLLFSAESIV